MEFDVTTSDFDEKVLHSKMPVLVDFWADWCMPCKAVAPLLAEIASEFEGKLDVARINVDEQEELAVKYDILSIPSLLLFKNGAVVEQQAGAVPKQAIIRLFSKHL